MKMRDWILNEIVCLLPFDIFGCLKSRPHLLFIRLFTFPLWTFLWFIDFILFPKFQELAIETPTFIFSPPTGSMVNPAGLLLQADCRLVSPKLHDFLFPFITVGRLFDFVDSLDKSNVFPGLKHIVNWIFFFVNRQAAELYRKHSKMGLWAEEEDDIFLAFWLWKGMFVDVVIPDVDYFTRNHTLESLTSQQKDRLMYLYRSIAKKILYRKGPTRLFLSTSRAIYWADPLLKEFPDARVVVLQDSRDAASLSIFLKPYIAKAISRKDNKSIAWISARVSAIIELKEMEDEFVSQSKQIYETKQKQKEQEQEQANKKGKVLLMSYEKFIENPIHDLEDYYSFFGLQINRRTRWQLEDLRKCHPTYEQDSSHKVENLSNSLISIKYL